MAGVGTGTINVYLDGKLDFSQTYPLIGQKGKYINLQTKIGNIIVKCSERWSDSGGTAEQHTIEIRGQIMAYTIVRTLGYQYSHYDDGEDLSRTWDSDLGQSNATYVTGNAYDGTVVSEGNWYYEYSIYIVRTPVTVTFDANGGENAPEPINGYYNDYVRLPTQIPTRNGYVFRFWGTSTTATIGYKPGSYIYLFQVRLYAIWNKVHTHLLIRLSDGGLLVRSNGAAGMLLRDD